MFGNILVMSTPNSSVLPFNISKVFINPSSAKLFCTPSVLSPIACNACSASAAGFFNEDSIAVNCVAPTAAFVPVLDIAAIAAPTWSNETPILDAIGITPPIAPANSLDSNLPSRTAAVKTSVAASAFKDPSAYAFIAEVVKSAIVAVSPNPAAAAFVANLRVSNDSAVPKPAEVIKNKALAASLLLTPVASAIFLALSPILSTSSLATPTSAFILVIDLSKSNPIFTLAPPNNAIGNATACKEEPSPFSLPPNDFNLLDALETALFKPLASPFIFTLNGCVAIS